VPRSHALSFLFPAFFLGPVAEARKAGHFDDSDDDVVPAPAPAPVPVPAAPAPAAARLIAAPAPAPAVDVLQEMVARLTTENRLLKQDNVRVNDSATALAAENGRLKNDLDKSRKAFAITRQQLVATKEQLAVAKERISALMEEKSALLDKAVRAILK
jgi:hypothetical protein